MPTPRLASEPVRHPSGLCALRVTRAGSFDGAWIDAPAQVVLADRAPRDGDRVVIVPRGPGAPRLGFLRGDQLFGAAEEPCQQAWWQVLGPVARIEVSRPLPASPVLELPLRAAA